MSIAATSVPPTHPPTEGKALPLGDGRLTLSVPEAAGLLGISRALAYELVARGELPSLRLGRRVVVPVARLVELVAAD